MSRDDLKRVTQIAIVVRDIEKASSIWSELLGLEKPIIEETEGLELTHMTFRDKLSKRAREVIVKSGICEGASRE